MPKLFGTWMAIPLSRTQRGRASTYQEGIDYDLDYSFVASQDKPGLYCQNRYSEELPEVLKSIRRGHSEDSEVSVIRN